MNSDSSISQQSARLEQLSIHEHDNASIETAQPAEESDLPIPRVPNSGGISPELAIPNQDAEWYADFKAWRERNRSPLTWLHQRRPAYNASDFNRFVCYALNKLQEPLKPLPGRENDFFRSESLESIEICEVYDTWDEVALTCISIAAWKHRGVSGDVIYTLEANVVCYGTDQDPTWSRDPIDGLEVSIIAEWINDDKNTLSQNDEENKWDRLDFNGALLLLRRAAKKKFKKNGRRRGAREAEASPTLGDSGLTVWGLMPGQLEVPRQAPKSSEKGDFGENDILPKVQKLVEIDKSGYLDVSANDQGSSSAGSSSQAEGSSALQNFMDTEMTGCDVPLTTPSVFDNV
ncbi:hypothetical protein ONS95_000313 [Cadophora gregata]|uniref:uncharacterized protein n=1 Tax=Cadophora gregata TaxID=51156 RepID=UPI0026DA945B|nr:uncharacterized protein ONS95_000313 [Cadophora gregata]KAK0125684.1 hypothetical protein ONS96_009517 [Cadophora gregata f. sp. sojae]KAK0128338.1 hypothetical protein ONS95_000313 [Cadophora gregata]